MFDKVRDALQTGKVVRFATIVATSGSTPAPQQSRMAIIFDDGLKVYGTVGGGCLDGGILGSLGAESDHPQVTIATYYLNDDEGESGLMCGGSVLVMQETPVSGMLPLYEQICEALLSNTPTLLLTYWNQHDQYRKTLLELDGSIRGGDPIVNELQSELTKARESCIASRKTIVQESSEWKLVLEFLDPQPRLIVFGGGHVGKVTTQCAALAGFRVTIADDRISFANRDRFPEAEEVVCDDFSTIVDRMRIDQHSYIVIVTRGHRHDELILEQVITRSPRYIGMIGSKRKILLTYEHLKARGISESDLQKVHAPIGMKINAQSPGEIGVAIVAELIAVWRGALDH